MKQFKILLGLAMLALSATLSAKAITQDGFDLPTDRPVSIVVFRPDVVVGRLSVGGMGEPNADWTADARRFMAASLQRSQATQRHKISFMADAGGADAARVAEYTALFRAVSGAVMTHKMFRGNRLPTKKDRFDWTMGPGVARLSRATGGADYGLFFYTYDQYGSDARKVAQVAALILGIGFIPAGIHVGYAGLVDLKTGDIVWFNTDLSMGGDVRTAEGADKRVGQLLRGFPGLPEPEPERR